MAVPATRFEASDRTGPGLESGVTIGTGETISIRFNQIRGNPGPPPATRRFRIAHSGPGGSINSDVLGWETISKDPRGDNVAVYQMTFTPREPGTWIITEWDTRKAFRIIATGDPTGSGYSVGDPMPEAVDDIPNTTLGERPDVDPASTSGGSDPESGVIGKVGVGIVLLLAGAAALLGGT